MLEACKEKQQSRTILAQLSLLDSEEHDELLIDAAEWEHQGIEIAVVLQRQCPDEWWSSKVTCLTIFYTKKH